MLVSGAGSNLQALLDHFHRAPDTPARVVRVVANRPDAPALARATAAGVPTVVVPTRGRDPSLWSRDLQAALDAAQPDLVVLAGFLARVPPPVVAAYAGRMLNLHPALLPAFGGPGLYGRRVHEAVLRAGVRVTGATVHWVTDELDAGPIVAQWPVPVLPGDTPDTLAARVQQVEHRLLPATVEALLRGGAPPAPPPFHFAPAAAPPSVEELPRWMPPAR